MNTFMWESPVTVRHLGQLLDDRAGLPVPRGWTLDHAPAMFAQHLPQSRADPGGLRLLTGLRRPAQRHGRGDSDRGSRAIVVDRAGLRRATGRFPGASAAVLDRSDRLNRSDYLAFGKPLALKPRAGTTADLLLNRPLAGRSCTAASCCSGMAIICQGSRLPAPLRPQTRQRAWSPFAGLAPLETPQNKRNTAVVPDSYQNRSRVRAGAAFMPSRAVETVVKSVRTLLQPDFGGLVRQPASGPVFAVR